VTTGDGVTDCRNASEAIVGGGETGCVVAMTTGVPHVLQKRAPTCTAPPHFAHVMSGSTSTRALGGDLVTARDGATHCCAGSGTIAGGGETGCVAAIATGVPHFLQKRAPTCSAPPHFAHVMSGSTSTCSVIVSARLCAVRAVTDRQTSVVPLVHQSRDGVQTHHAFGRLPVPVTLSALARMTHSLDGFPVSVFPVNIPCPCS
jgi:hypothetical protein